MKGDPEVIGFLNEALRHELTTISQFWLHFRLLRQWGFDEMAHRWRRESIEDMEHADALMARLVFLRGTPVLQKLDPLMIGDTLREVLDADLKAVYRGRALYREARTVADGCEDQVSKRLFDGLLDEEEGRMDFLESQIDLYDRIGDAAYGELNARPADTTH